MNKTRLEAFSDGVLAIIITIMVLEIKVPHHAAGTSELATQFSDLQKLLPVFVSYVMSFIYIGIYWNNHHHMMHSMTQVNGKILWSNLYLLFWLSLVPFATGWMGENNFAKPTLTLYGVILLMAGFAYWILQNLIIASQGENSILKKAVGRDWKGKLSPVLYIIGIGLSFCNSWLSGAVYVSVAMMWLIPDKRIERTIAHMENEN